jgi:hypothetical protein
MKRKQRGEMSSDFSPERLKDRIEAWLAGAGEAQLGHTMRAADQACDSFRASIRVDPKTLDEPVTFEPRTVDR